MSAGRFVEVAVPLPLDETLDYALPDDLAVEPGARVLVPCAGRQVVGVVVAVRTEGVPRGKGAARAVVQVLDAAPLLPATLLDVVLRAAHDALCPPGLALAAAIPPGTAPRSAQRVSLLPAGRRALERGEGGGTLGKVLWALGRRALLESELRSRFPAAVPVLDRLERLRWVSRELTTAPPRVRPRTRRVYRLAPGATPELLRTVHARAPRRLELIELLGGGPRPLASSGPLRALVAAGVVVFRDEEFSRATVEEPMVPHDRPPELTSHQREAVGEIDAAIAARRDQVFLLYGITGSGKTEVYLRAAEEALRCERGVIVLVPEISLTHQVVDRFRARFGASVFVLHSGLSPGARFDHWRTIRETGRGIAIGARSAVFAPFEDLGLIVLDEEHDPSYKSDDAFRYHARDLAQLRARASGCPLVLGSATPDVETAWRSRQGDVQRLVLPERIASRPLPEVEIVDMSQEHKLRGRRMLLSRTLRHALAETLAANQQAILFLNRRGFATQVYCFNCGYAIRCQHCDVSLVYHATGGPRRVDDPAEGELCCHYCGYREDPKPTCPGCGSAEGALLGFGTERLQEEVAAMFPHAQVTRFDRDTSSGKGKQRAILAAFHRREIDVLVGTQMVAKGHDVPGVTLVGVIAADLGLHFPDFRAGERTFQLLTQVAGRAGRGDEPGRVVIQTFLPDHYAIALARTHDYPRFFSEELARREPHGYPPFRALAQVVLSGRKAEVVEEAAAALARLARTVPRDGAHPAAFEVLGPAPAPLTRLRDQYRWQVLLLGEREQIRHVAAELWRQGRGRFPGVSLRLDAGPIQML